MSIRLQLLLIALTTLVLPWAGCQYAREVQTVLRASQEQALLASAGTIASALAGQPQRMLHDAEAGSRFEKANGDIYAFPLRATPLLDGYRDDWGIPQEPQTLPSQQGYKARLQAGVTERYLFLYMEVEDPRFDAPGSDFDASRKSFDRVEIALQHPDGALENYFFATNAPGMIEAQTTVAGDDGRHTIVSEPRIQAFWLQTARGYHLEIRIPQALVGARLWIEAIDGEAGSKKRAGTLDLVEQRRGGRLFYSSGSLSDWLKPFIRAGTRATVIDRNALKLTSIGSFSEAAGRSARPRIAWYRRFRTADSAGLPLRSSAPDRILGEHIDAALQGRPQAQWFRTGRDDEVLLAAAVPIALNGEVIGAIVLEQSGNELLSLRDAALGRLFNLTMIATGIVVACAFGYSTWLSARIGRLRAAADTAISPDGKIRLDLPDGDRHDEIGALSRGFSRLLVRLNEHTQYLRTLGGKLAHELRTPLTIVRSSLDNLELEGVSSAQQTYLRRAHDGADRLQSILGALGAAARVEESIAQAERVSFDLKALVESAVAAYRDGFKERHFDSSVPPGPCHWRGAPDLIAQMLDKLVENAVDFAPVGGRIGVRLESSGGRYSLSVANDGAPIPQGLLRRLFEPLFELREAKDDKPHFGLGLYIVRLIVEFHGGSVAAANRTDAPGAIFTADLPMI